MADYGHPLRFGSFITPLAADPARVVHLAQVSEVAGLDLVTFQDHPYQPRFLDTWTLLSYVAARTHRVQLAPDVACLPLRPPAMLARAVATLDLLSGGRAALGLGAGAFWNAIEAMGGPRREPGEAVDAVRDALDVLRSLWDAAEPDRVQVEGSVYRVVGARRGPAPAHDVPVWVGATRPRMLRLVGSRADGWLPSYSYLGGAAVLPGMNATIDEAAVAAGRSPADVVRLLNIGPEQAEPKLLATLALEHGVSTFILAADEEAALTAYGQEIAPEVRALVAARRG